MNKQQPVRVGLIGLASCHAACSLGGARDIGFCPRRNTSMIRMRPPQHGHGSRKVSGAISCNSSGSAVCSARWTPSKDRIFVMLVLRTELARRP